MSDSLKTKFTANPSVPSLLHQRELKQISLQRIQVYLLCYMSDSLKTKFTANPSVPSLLHQ